MGIVLNEKEWVENIIARRSMGDNHGETMIRIARYYFWKGYKKSEVRRMCLDYIRQNGHGDSIQKWEANIDKTLKYALKRQLAQIDSIIITEPEVNKIRSLEGVQLQRVAFTLLCVSKYWDAMSDDNDGWVNCDDSEIKNMANVCTSTLRYNLMYHKLVEIGYLKLPKRVDNLNIMVTFAEDGFPAIVVRDMRNLGYQYMRYLGGEYFNCAVCGLTEKQTTVGAGRRKKYCARCAEDMKKIHSVEFRKRMQQSAIYCSAE